MNRLPIKDKYRQRRATPAAIALVIEQTEATAPRYAA